MEKVFHAPKDVLIHKEPFHGSFRYYGVKPNGQVVAYTLRSLGIECWVDQEFSVPLSLEPFTFGGAKVTLTIATLDALSKLVQQVRSGS